ncbi:response regulator [Mucilaginibacter sp. UR6-1]|uniref:response regulator n=1 Tax=Mucilaginibacter sp. UR6-1 TaxID=1435643 RepID=UPI001E296F61|nr:response regulator [Mucilaginibacter sp. UR6-1]MCC8410104.1 response regulator [Mucilaginibacter sp. UR6-1]
MKKSVVLIENDAAIAEVVDYILTELGCDVIQTPAKDYANAISAYNPGLIMLDYSLGGDLTGDQICRNLKSDSTTANIPVVLVSAINGLEEAGRMCDADDVLAKPFDITDLEKLVNKWLGTDRIAS